MALSTGRNRRPGRSAALCPVPLLLSNWAYLDLSLELPERLLGSGVHFPPGGVWQRSRKKTRRESWC